MTEAETRFWSDKFGQVLHHALVDIRNLSYDASKAQQINDLADVIHNVPLFMIGRDPFVLNYFRVALMEYLQKYLPGIDPSGHRYLRILDMEETEFRRLYPTTSMENVTAKAVA